MSDQEVWRHVLNEQAQVMAFFGALGGAVRAVVLKTTLWESIRVAFVGGATSFSAGTLAPGLLKPYVGEITRGSDGTIGTLCASAFLLGLLANTIMERAIDRKKEKEELQE